jgi:hypothetical protein
MTGVDDRLRRAAAALDNEGRPIPPFAGAQRRARRRRVFAGLGAVVIVVAGVVTAATATRNDDRLQVQQPGPTSTSLPPETTTVPAPPVTERSRVTIFLLVNERVFAVGRDVEGPATPESAVRALLEAPIGAGEADLGFTSAIPAGTTVNAVRVDGPVATVDLSEQFASGGGSLSMQARVAQVVFTLTHFSSIERVRFELDGSPVSTIGGEGVPAENVGRADFADVTPLILVESPTPGETVGAPLHVRGMSNTFEATVNYTLTEASPNICPSCAEGVIAEGFTTATAGSGTWGTFEFDIDFDVEQAGNVVLSVYEVSARDGMRINEATIPLRVEP